MIRRIVLLVGLAFSLHPVRAQLHLEATLQNNHLWRGIEVADGLVLTTDVSLTDRSGHLRIGLWGGTNTQGTYKEFNNYLSYTYKGFSLALWDTYNFSPSAAYNNKEFFNYKARSTGRFLDAIVSYRFGESFPLLISWSTIIFGRDRNADNTANKYSTFCYAEYPVYQKEEWRVDAGMGGTFALNRTGDSSNFYGDTSGMVHIMLKVSRNVNLGKWEIPVFACALWNPQGDRALFQLGARIISF